MMANKHVAKDFPSVWYVLMKYDDNGRQHSDDELIERFSKFTNKTKRQMETNDS